VTHRKAKPIVHVEPEIEINPIVYVKPKVVRRHPAKDRSLEDIRAESFERRRETWRRLS